MHIENDIYLYASNVVNYSKGILNLSTSNGYSFLGLKIILNYNFTLK